MTTPDVEARTRTALHGLAATTTPLKPSIDELLARRAVAVTPPRRRWIDWRIGLAAASVAAVGVAGVIVLANGSGDGRPAPSGPPVSEQTSAPSVAPDTTVPVVPDGGEATAPAPRVVAEMLPAAGDASLLTAFGRMWLAGTDDQVLQAYDTATQAITLSVTLDGSFAHIAADNEAIYVCGSDGIVRIDPGDGSVTARDGEPCAGIAAAFGSAWTLGTDNVRRLEPRSLQVQSTVDVAGRPITDVAAVGGSIWVTADAAPGADSGSVVGQVVRIDPATNEVTATVVTPGRARVLVEAGGRLWVTLEPRPEHDLTGLVAVDPAVATIVASVAQSPIDPFDVIDTGSFLVAGSRTDEVMLIDPATGTVRSTVGAGGDRPGPPGVRSIAWDGTRLWSYTGSTTGIGGSLAVVDLAPSSAAPTAPTVVRRVPSAAGDATIVASVGRLWQAGQGRLIAIDPATGDVVDQREVGDGLDHIAAGADAVYLCGTGGAARVPLGGGDIVRSDERCRRGIAADEDGVWLAQGNTVARLDPTTLATQQSFDVPSATGGITLAFGAVWVAGGEPFGDTGTLTRIDRYGDRAPLSVPLPGSAQSVLEVDGSLWVTLWPSATTGRSPLVRIDPDTSEVVQRIDHTVFDAAQLVRAGSYVIASSGTGPMAVFEPATMRLVHTFDLTSPVGQVDLSNIAWDGSLLWTRIPQLNSAGSASSAGGQLVAIDLGSFGSLQPSPGPQQARTIARVDVPSGPANIAFGFDRVWLAGTDESALTQYDTVTDQAVATLDLPPGAVHAATGPHAMYICGPGGTVRVDPSANAITATDPQPCDAIAADDLAVWTLDRAAGVVRRLDLMTLATAATIDAPNNGRAIAATAGRVWVAGADVAPVGPRRGRCCRSAPQTTPSST